MENEESPGRLAPVLNRELGDKKLIVLLGVCDTVYEGRSAAYTEPGDKIVLVKSDGSVIVHGPTGFRPLNWQPDTIHLEFQGFHDRLELRAIRGKPRETLVVRCYRIHGYLSHRPGEKGGFYMYFSEAEVRDLLAANPELLEEGLRITGVEKPVEPGFIDLYGIDRDGNVVVFEIKRVKAGEEAAKQLARYVSTLRRTIPRIRGVLVAPDFTNSALEFLARNGLEAKKIDLDKLYHMHRQQVLARRGIREKSLLDFF